MKRGIALLLVLLLFAGQCAAAGAEEAVLRVGNPTPMDGKFFTGCWGNATSDIDVRALVHGYRLFVWSGDLRMFRQNPAAVRAMATAEDEEGNRCYMIILHDDLKYSDGTPITAWDYAFSVLFQGSPLLEELGARPMDLEYLEGYEEYAEGEASCLRGLKVTGPYSLSFTVRKEALPYFFELYRLAFVPYPIHEIAPGCRVYDDGDGCYIDNDNRELEEKLFTAELLKATVMDPEEGYLAYPTVGSGPYRLTGWDGKTCRFEINPYFKGDEDGNKPTIPKLEYTLAENETMTDLLAAGEFGLLNKVTRKDTIDKGLEVCAGGQFASVDYPRIGLTFIVFTPDSPALQQQKVRQAVAYCLDKEKTVSEYVGDYGQPMDVMAGIGQWMYQLVNGTLDYPAEELPDLAGMNLDGVKKYPLNIPEANRLLEEAGWTLNREGGEYRPGEDDVRCRETGGELVPLELVCAYPETNITAGSLERLFAPNLAQAGIRLSLVAMDMKTLLKAYNDRKLEGIDMFYLGDDFNVEFDPKLFFLHREEEAPEEDDLACTHDRMYELADRMARTEPWDIAGFIGKWTVFQEELSERLPLIPVYSNFYYDFYTAGLKNYSILPKVTWGEALTGGSLSTPQQ